MTTDKSEGSRFEPFLPTLKAFARLYSLKFMRDDRDYLHYVAEWRNENECRCFILLEPSEKEIGVSLQVRCVPRSFPDDYGHGVTIEQFIRYDPATFRNALERAYEWGTRFR